LDLHPWAVDYASARAIQDRLRTRIIRRGAAKNVRLIAGADVSYDKSGNRFYAAVVVMEYPQLSVVETVTSCGVATFPYIPGMLTFREGPIVLDAFRKLRRAPDLVIFDGQGVAHPRGFGLASHLGLLLDLPSIGCAKTRLCGEHDEPGPNATDCAPLTYDGRRVGMVVRTKRGVRPVYVSIGHRISISSAVDWVIKCCRGYRLPEPTRQAHLTVNRLRLKAREKEG
jgi:deoxyribonuclease V